MFDCISSEICLTSFVWAVKSPPDLAIPLSCRGEVVLRILRRALSNSKMLGALKAYLRRRYSQDIYHRFDADFYRATFLCEVSRHNGREPFEHYMHEGCRLGYSPNSWFDEEWYRAFYQDVRRAIDRGDFLCGFQHYLLAGKREGRQPRYELQKALEGILPSVTEPVLQKRVEDLSLRMEPLQSRLSADAPRTFWVVMPHLNPDIVFGGYRALFELMIALAPFLRENGFRVAVVTTAEREANAAYFQYRQKDERIRALFSDIVVQSRHELVVFGPRDRFLTYSAWDALIVSRIASQTDEPRVISLIQEYEPIFHDHSSYHAICASGFDVPSFSIFNSEALKEYFRVHSLGVFKRSPHAKAFKDYVVFEQPINLLPFQSQQALAQRSERILALYARPEGHAARNLYEIAELALRELCSTGRLDDRWSIIGLGCLSQLPAVKLGGGHVLEFFPKMAEDEYVARMTALDIGISLMYSPHPSLVPFEFATTGALVVTNTFQNRPAEFFRARSANIIPCEPTVTGVRIAIEKALLRIDDFDTRVRNAYRPQSTWESTFSSEFVRSNIGPLLF